MNDYYDGRRKELAATKATGNSAARAEGLSAFDSLTLIDIAENLAALSGAGERWPDDRTVDEERTRLALMSKPDGTEWLSVPADKYASIELNADDDHPLALVRAGLTAVELAALIALLEAEQREAADETSQPPLAIVIGTQQRVRANLKVGTGISYQYGTTTGEHGISDSSVWVRVKWDSDDSMGPEEKVWVDALEVVTEVSELPAAIDEPEVSFADLHADRVAAVIGESDDLNADFDTSIEFSGEPPAKVKPGSKGKAPKAKPAKGK